MFLSETSTRYLDLPITQRPALDERAFAYVLHRPKHLYGLNRLNGKAKRYGLAEANEKGQELVQFFSQKLHNFVLFIFSFRKTPKLCACIGD